MTDPSKAITFKNTNPSFPWVGSWSVELSAISNGEPWPDKYNPSTVVATQADIIAAGFVPAEQFEVLQLEAQQLAGVLLTCSHSYRFTLYHVIKSLAERLSTPAASPAGRIDFSPSPGVPTADVDSGEAIPRERDAHFLRAADNPGDGAGASKSAEATDCNLRLEAQRFLKSLFLYDSRDAETASFASDISDVFKLLKRAAAAESALKEEQELRARYQSERNHYRGRAFEAEADRAIISQLTRERDLNLTLAQNNNDWFKSEQEKSAGLAAKVAEYQTGAVALAATLGPKIADLESKLNVAVGDCEFVCKQRAELTETLKAAEGERDELLAFVRRNFRTLFDGLHSGANESRTRGALTAQLQATSDMTQLIKWAPLNTRGAVDPKPADGGGKEEPIVSGKHTETPGHAADCACGICMGWTDEYLAMAPTPAADEPIPSVASDPLVAWTEDTLTRVAKESDRKRAESDLKELQRDPALTELTRKLELDVRYWRDLSIAYAESLKAVEHERDERQERLTGKSAAYDRLWDLVEEKAPSVLEEFRAQLGEPRTPTRSAFDRIKDLLDEARRYETLGLADITLATNTRGTRPEYASLRSLQLGLGALADAVEAIAVEVKSHV